MAEESKWNDPVDLTEELDAVKVKGNRPVDPIFDPDDKPYATVSDLTDKELEELGLMDKKRMEELTAEAERGYDLTHIKPVERNSLRQRPAQLVEQSIASTPKGYRQVAMARAVGFAHVSMSTLEQSLEWLGIIAPDLAAEYTDMLDKAAEFYDRIHKQYERRKPDEPR